MSLSRRSGVPEGKKEVMFHVMGPREGRAAPWRFMIFGGVGAGKTTLLRALEGKEIDHVLKTQMVDYSGWGIDTPGEFSELGRLRRLLVSASFDAVLLVAVHDATHDTSSFPPNYFLTFPKETIGVVAKIDLPEADPERGSQLLRQAGVTGEIFCVSAHTGEGISSLRNYLLEHNPGSKENQRWQTTMV
jgi:ethanolamine utilization protein EutP